MNYRITCVGGWACVCFALAVSVAAPASAQSLSAAQVRAADAVLELDREAMGLFAQLEFALAQRSLAKAAALARKDKLEAHAVMARVQWHLAVVTLVGLNNEPQALTHLQQAVAIDPDLKVQQTDRRPELEALLAKLQTPEATDASTVDASLNELVAAAPKQPPSGKAPVVNAAYRAEDETTLVQEEQEDDEENPLEPKRVRGDGPKMARRFWLGLALGSGLGYASGAGLEAYKEYGNAFSPGMTTSGGAHVAPEFGWHATEHVALALATRHQYLVGNDERMARGANAVLAKVMLFGSGRFVRPMAALGVGGGEGFRLLVQARADGRVFRDTVRGGPGVGLVGVGAAFLLSRTIAGTLEANTMMGFPDFSLGFDVNVGMRFYL